MKKLLPFLVSFLSISMLHAQPSLNMTLLANWDDDDLPTQSNVQYNDIWGYVDCDGNEYAIMGSAQNIHFFDLSTPTNPIEIDRFPGTSLSLWRDIKTFQNRAYSVADQGNDGLFIFDLSQVPTAVSQSFQTTDYFGQAHNIFIDEANGRLYAVGTDTRANGVIILDLNANADDPVLLADIPLLGGYVHDIYVRDNIGYCSHGNSGFYIYDFTVPQAPVLLGSLTNYPESGYNHSSWLHADGQRLVFVDETFGTSAKMVDVSDPLDMNITDLFKSELLFPDATGSIIHNPFIRGNYVIASYYHDGIQVFDMTDPTNVTQVAYYDTFPSNIDYAGFRGCWGVYPFFPSGTIIGSDISNGLFVVELEGIALEPMGYVSYPSAEINIDGPQTICAGESLTLTLEENSPIVNWVKDGVIFSTNTNSITITESGQYYAEVSNGKCTTLSATVDLEVVDLIVPSFPKEGYTICEEGAILVSGPGGAAIYRWYLNGELVASSTEPTFEITQPGDYQLEVINENCSAVSAVFPVVADIFGNLPTIAFSDPLCLGDAALILYNSFCQDENCLIYLFKNEELVGTYTEDITITEAGDYYITIENTLSGCQTNSNDFTVNIDPAEAPIINQQDNILSTPVLEPGTTYQWYFNGSTLVGETNPELTAVSSGEYYVQVFTPNGCLAASEPVSIILSSVQSSNLSDSVRLFPNPSRFGFNIQATRPMEGPWALFNYQGKVVLQGDAQQRSSFYIEHASLPSGVYLFQLNSAAGMVSKWVVIEQ